jgi:NAD(P)H-hydrate epimerase
LLPQWLPQYDALLLGCGLGQSQPTIEFVQQVLTSLPKGDCSKVVLDADGLNVLAKIPKWWQNLSEDAILTPHPGEMSRLCSLSIEEIQSDRLSIAKQMAGRWGKIVVLKGAYTVVASPRDLVRVSSVANPGLASAGTGDVLAGVIAGLLAQGLEAFEAACCGVYLHGAAGEMVAGELGNAGMVASDLLRALPRVIKKTKGG